MKTIGTTLCLCLLIFGTLLSLTACKEFKNITVNIPLELEEEEILGTSFSAFNDLKDKYTPWPNKKYIQNSEFDISFYRLSVPHDEIGYYTIDYTFYEDLFIQKEYSFPVLIELNEIVAGLTKQYGEPTFRSEKTIITKQSFLQKLTSLGQSQKETASPIDEVLFSFEKEGKIAEIILQDYNNFQDKHLLRFRFSDEALLTMQRDMYANSIKNLDTLHFSEIEPFYNGFTRGKVASIWHLVQEEGSNLFAFEGYHVYDSSYADNGIVILQKIQDPNLYGVQLSICDLKGNILVENLMSYHRDPSGSLLLADILFQEGDSIYLQKYEITPELFTDGSLNMKLLVEQNSYEDYGDQNRHLLDRYGYRVNSIRDDEGSTEEIYDREGNLVFSLFDKSFLGLRISNGVFITQIGYEDPVYYTTQGIALSNVKELIRIYNPAFKSFERDIFYNESSFPQPEGIDTSYHFTYVKTADQTYLFGPQNTVCTFSELQEIDVTKTIFHQGKPYFYLKDFENTLFGYIDMEKNPFTAFESTPYPITSYTKIQCSLKP